MNPGSFTQYTGFTEKEILELCDEAGMETISSGEYESLWQKTSVTESLISYILKFAYVACLDRFLKVEELPSGKGLADIVFLPKQNTAYPAMLIELKWNRSAEGALKQIKEKRYPAILEGYGGEIVLVGINYDTKTKKHDCVIERIIH